MNEQPAANNIRVWIAISAFLMVMTISVRAQSPPQSTQPANVTNAERVRQQEMSRREWQLRNMGTEPAPTPNDRKPLGEQIQEDFMRILTLHNELVRTLQKSEPLNHGVVSEAAVEIRKRASRLQTTLALPKPESKQENQETSTDINEKQIRDAITMLCKQIERFVNNPIITTPGTVDARELTRARQDLDGIVETSGNIRKGVDKLKKDPH